VRPQAPALETALETFTIIKKKQKLKNKQRNSSTAEHY